MKKIKKSTIKNCQFLVNNETLSKLSLPLPASEICPGGGEKKNIISLKSAILDYWYIKIYYTKNYRHEQV